MLLKNNKSLFQECEDKHKLPWSRLGYKTKAYQLFYDCHSRIDATLQLKAACCTFSEG